MTLSDSATLIRSFSLRWPNVCGIRVPGLVELGSIRNFLIWSGLSLDPTTASLGFILGYLLIQNFGEATQ